jgi:hypothetical protein
VIDFTASIPTPAEIAGNEIWQFLQSIDLPWCQSREVLKKRFGRRFDPDDSTPVTDVPVQLPLWQNLFEPLHFRHRDPCREDLPPTSFVGSLHIADKVDINFFHLKHGLEALLGAGDSASVANTIGWRWHDGPADISITAWPPELNTQYGENAYHTREPRLITACSIYINTGFQLKLSADEQHLLETVQPLLEKEPGSAGSVPSYTETRVEEHEMEFTRTSQTGVAALDTHICLSADGTTLVAGTARHFRLLPVADLAKIEVDRCLPAKGSGYALLSVSCRTGMKACPVKHFRLAERAQADDFNDDAALLAKRLGIPFSLSDYYNDV